MEELVERVARFAEDERLFRGARRVVAGVSGGPDSLALMVVLQALASRFRFELVVAHFDHQLRPDSREDLEFVRRVAAERGLKCVTGEGDVAARARETRRGIEEVARELRYQFLGFVAQRERADTVAVGHTADDQAETVLLRIVRGTGIRGLRGMVPVAPLPGAPALRLVRPLLVLRRAETLAVCQAAGLEARRDPSNESLAFARNRIRRMLLPALRELNPAIERALTGLARSAAEAFEELERLALAARPAERSPEGVIFGLDALRRLPTESLLLVLEREAAYLQQPVASNATRLENARRVLQCGQGEVSFGGLVLEASCGLVRLGPAVQPLHFTPTVLEVPGVTPLGPVRVAVRTEPGPDGWVALDRGRVRGVLRARPLLPGDRIVVRGVRKKVSDWLTEQRVPRWTRRRTVAVADAEGVVALLGCPPSCNPPPATDDCLYLRLERSTG
ncbi:tRNA(Ile)-lysidine synthase [bacterium HR29]|nr:tRNA(Ile)-lysidine synthase [bacterium HR29]